MTIAVVMYVLSYFPYGFESRIWDLIVSVPDLCLSFFFALHPNTCGLLIFLLIIFMLLPRCGAFNKAVRDKNCWSGIHPSVGAKVTKTGEY